jgi:hypothetical protein
MTDTSAVFQALRALLVPYVGRLRVLKDDAKEFTLISVGNTYQGKPMWFGGVRIGKAYVSFHLMPLYMNPPMIARIPAELKKRMQGKSCLNFKKVDEEAFAQLAALTEAGYEDYRKRGWV